MMHAGHTLHIARKLDYSLIRAGLRLHVLSRAQLFEYLALYPAFFASHRLLFSGFKGRAVWSLLSLDILLLTRAQLAANAARHLLRAGAKRLLISASSRSFNSYSSLMSATR